MPNAGETNYTLRLTCEHNHVMLLLDVSPYMYRYDYSTFSLSIQNLEDLLVLLFRLLGRRAASARLALSLYACSVDSPELYVPIGPPRSSTSPSRSSAKTPTTCSRKPNSGSSAGTLRWQGRLQRVWSPRPAAG